MDTTRVNVVADDDDDVVNFQFDWVDNPVEPRTVEKDYHQKRSMKEEEDEVNTGKHVEATFESNPTTIVLVPGHSHR